MADKSYKPQSMRTLGDEQRRLMLADLARRIVDLRLQQATNRLSATSELQVARRALARLKTIMHEGAVKERHAAIHASNDATQKAFVDGLKAATLARSELIVQNDKARLAAAEKKAKAKPKADKAKAKAAAAPKK